jgi:hypothetical protein
MTATLGDDWRTFFDVICCYCRKPLFFWDQKPSPFFPYNPKDKLLRGKAINDCAEMKETPGEIYTEGNAKLLSNHFKKILGIEGEIRVAFFGD